jgi:hypothetical protein
MLINRKTYEPSDLPFSREDVQQDRRVKGNYRYRYTWRPFTRTITVNYPSDGLLPQYTQELQGIPPGNRYKIEGANHKEVFDISNSSVFLNQ